MNAAAPAGDPPRVVCDAPRLARIATRSLYRELALHPKPGLVSLRDSGAHSDMDATTFMRSLFALRGYFRDVAAAGARNAEFAELRVLAIAAESAMLKATGGVNTHRGAIFSMGLLLASAACLATPGRPIDAASWRAAIVAQFGTGLAYLRHERRRSHGADVERITGAQGALGEAIAGFPHVFDVALPALRNARQHGLDERLAQLGAFFELLACIEDTNVLFRGGFAALALVRQRARSFLRNGGAFARDALERASELHSEMSTRGLSPGGCADLFACTLLVDALVPSPR